MFTFYEVGGKVRDELMGLVSKDVDYVAVPSEHLIYSKIEIGNIYKFLVDHLESEGFSIFLKTPECYTIRAMFPKNHIHSGVADFVLARKEIGYISGTRTPIVVPGTLLDDLSRRDFTVNSIAKDDQGKHIDPFNGINDIKLKVLRTPISGAITFEDDPLRLLRALRFAITKGFQISQEIHEILKRFSYQEKFNVVSEERIREELYKMFKYDTSMTWIYLDKYDSLRKYIFKNTNLWLKPTNEQ